MIERSVDMPLAEITADRGIGNDTQQVDSNSEEVPQRQSQPSKPTRGERDNDWRRRDDPNGRDKITPSGMSSTAKSVPPMDDQQSNNEHGDVEANNEASL